MKAKLPRTVSFRRVSGCIELGSSMFNVSVPFAIYSEDMFHSVQVPFHKLFRLSFDANKGDRIISKRFVKRYGVSLYLSSVWKVDSETLRLSSVRD